MIKLVILSDISATMTRCFEQTIVTIGADGSPYADVSLPGETLEERHVQIIDENSRFIVVNLANDPFVTLNGQPFGKKTLKPNDVIQIGNTSIRFELETPPKPPVVEPPSPPLSIPKMEPQDADLVDTKNVLPVILEDAIKAKADSNPSSFVIPWNEEKGNVTEQQLYDAWTDDILKKSLSTEEDEQLDIDALVRQVEELAEHDEAFSKYIDIPSESNLDIRSEQPPSVSEQISKLHEQEASEPSELPPIQQIPQEQEKHPLAQSLAAAHLEPLAPSAAAISAPEKVPTLSNGTSKKLHLKDYYLSEYDDVHEQNPTAQAASESHVPKLFLAIRNWRLYLKILIVILALAAIGAGLVFLWMTDQSDKEEINASKGVADVALALTYAQIKHIHPQNQNWSDPEFIKNNLIAVLGSKYPSLADFDTHGQFANSPYMLRIYTSGDLSQFLVMAQPAPSLLQWLIPKTTIIIDSHAMEMRKIRDLKSLNRLLVNANTLDGTNAAEVSHLIQQGSLIPLVSLVNKTENQGFSPPKALALLRPGAENLVYNAPRYFPLGEELMKKSLDLIEKPASSHEVTMLQQELSSLGKFPNVILYSSSGIQHATQAQKALSTLAPKEKFLIAYLQLNAKGQIVNSHLVMDDAPQDVAVSDTANAATHRNAVTKLTLEKADHSIIETDTKELEENHKAVVGPTGTKVDIDEDNPLFLQLSALNVFRQQALRLISEEMIQLLNKETQFAQPNFASRYQQLLNKYLEVKNEQQAKIIRKLEGIYKENLHLQASDFLNLAKVAGLEEPLQEYLATLKHQMKTPEFTQEKMDKRLQKIEKAANWQDLELIVAETVDVLNLERIPEENQLLAYQNATRSRVIQKLNQFLLSPEHSLPPQAFDPEYRYTLIHILKMAWITDSDTYDFYLSEFDLRSIPRSQSKEEDGEEEDE